ncbi:MAG TPA: RDD family protein [Thermoanaerobaculia bacterium]|nr:RDD family protein [Thermoanaerobaculia bacterium]
MTEEKWRYVLSAEGREIELSDGEVTLGRSRTSTVRLEHESVSRSHALLTFDRGEAVVKDLASSNGTFVGGKRIARETRLVNGDRLQLGAAVVEVRILAPNVASERTVMLPPDQLPDQPAEPPRPVSGITYEPVPGLTNPGLPGPGAPRSGPDPMSASELFRDVDREVAKQHAFAADDVFPRAGGAPDEVSTIAPPPLPPAAPAPPAAAPARELADYSIQLSDADKAARIPLAERAASLRDRRSPEINEGPRNVANPFARLLAVLVDAVILAAINVLLFAPVFLIDYFRAELQTRDAAPDWAFRAITALSFLLALLANVLYVVGGWAWRGRTPGKALLGLAVVRRGTPPGGGIGWPAAIIRAIVCVLAGLPLGLGWAWAFFEKEKRAFQDLAARTWVIRVR